MNQNLTYKEATQELEAILKAIETDAVDVDELTQKVQRSSELIKICKQKLRSAEAAINQVFEDIECNDEPETKPNSDKPATGKLF
ncbi:exodeoxyribonuclease VII small subunit [Adhaeribacter sp. BT258]|uniref:Exodeoxyribonuclease VII small subunit n=1 Tax=Adhaeribacter terrigena TaxID=2793070 RepID=A0ABS1C3U2_9BACT|nr:exodeoxyribonuclease VII small subunit [Adhaeribacter terrigena]MBK0404025.1 exodeoxyribonuclease VII small subunit [Adhaeribacter terrigena]